MAASKVAINRAQLNNVVKDTLRDMVDALPFWVEVVVTAARLDGAGNVPLFTPALQASTARYKVRNIRLVGGGVSYGAGGDRNISLTDGTTTWVIVPNATIEAAPAATVDWGQAGVPFNAGTSDSLSVAKQAIRFQYSGGTTDHGGVGSIKFSVCLEKI